MPKINRKDATFTQADGAQEVLTTNFHAPMTQVSFSTNSTAGTLAVRAKYHPKADFEVVYDEDGTTPLVIDLSNIKTFQFVDKWVYALQFTPSNVTHTYTPHVASGVLLQEGI